MRIADLEEQMFLYRAGALEGEDLAAVEALLEARDPGALEALAAADALLGDLPLALEAKTPPPQAGDALIERARASLQPPVELAPRRWLGPLAAAAGLALILGTSWAWIQRESEHQSTVDQLAEQMAAEHDRGLEFEARIRELESAHREDTRALASAEETLARLRDGAPTPDSRPAPEDRTAAATRPDRTSPRETALGERIAALEGELARTRSAYSEMQDDHAAQRRRLDRELAQARESLELVRAPDAGFVDLVSEDVGSRSSASVFWDGALRECYLHARALAPIAQAERYALWLEYEGGALHRVADFEVDARGDAELFEGLPKGMGDVERTFITREAAPGAERPGAVVLAELPASEAGDGRKGDRRYRRRSS